MPTVTIPPSHFINNVKKNYANYKIALIREFLQNSVDAGSHNISFNYQGNILTVEDDGCGMTKEILVNVEDENLFLPVAEKLKSKNFDVRFTVVDRKISS